jgi:hypothetical protein
MPCTAQSLRGSDESVDRMYRHARAEGLSFYETPRGVRKAVDAGTLVRLVPDGNFTLHAVGYPFVRPSTRTFVARLAEQHQSKCGEPLEVTSAVRPATRQPANSVEQSVHPTGMAIDLHKPDDAKCRQWLRETLLELEGAGVLEATEEYGPPHFHVAVYPTPYRQYVADRTDTAPSKRVATSQSSSGVSSSGTVYRVRRGDTLWDIARAHDTTAEAIRSANRLEKSVIHPGDELVIPPTP